MAVASHESGIFGRALQQVGRQVAGLGAEFKQQAEQEQRKLEAAQADEAINKTLSDQLELKVGQPSEGKKGGYLYQRSSAVVQPGPNGENFLDSYNAQFGARAEANGAHLTGGAKERYNAAIGRIRLDFQAGLLTHSLKETDDYYTQAHANTVKTEALNAGANWNNPVAVAESLRRISDATEREAVRRGGVDVDAAKQEQIATGVDAAARGALAAGDSRAAEGYLNEYKDIMPARMAQALSDAVGHQRGQDIALATAEKVSNTMKHRVMPSDYDRAVAIIGAGTKEDRARFDDLTKKYSGNVEKAWAAYEIGPKALAEAEVLAMKSERENKKDPAVPVKSWIEFVPKETRASVEDKRKTFVVGGGVTEPSRLEAEEMAVRIARADNPNATPEQLEAARTKAGQWFADLKAARAQVEENALLDVQQRVDVGRIRSVQDLTPQDWSLLGGKRTSARAYIDGAQGDQDKMVQASPAAREVYDRLMASPDVLKDYDAATIMSLTPELGKKWVDDLLRRKQDYLTNPEKFTAARVDADLFEATVEPFMKGVSRSAAAGRKHQIRLAVEAEIGRRRASGEPGLSIEKDKPSIITKYAMTYPVEKPGFLFGTNIKQVPGALLPQEYTLPPEDAAKIDAKAAKLGLHNLSDDDRMQIYRKMKAAEAAK
jgi:hypothetical protein